MPDVNLTQLQRDALLVLLNGVESTLLLVEALNRTKEDVLYSEADVLEALRDLEGHRLLKSRQDDIPSPDYQNGGVPEYQQGRDHVIWWGLTPEGRLFAKNDSSATQ